MQNFSASPKEMLASLWRHRGLIKASAKREVLGRYRGSVMGLFWSFVNPVLMLAVFTFAEFVGLIIAMESVSQMKL